MGPVAIIKKAASGVYTLLAVLFLSCWILVALALTALSAANRDAGGIASLVAPPTLLVYLASKLVVILAGAQNASVARWIASADDGSPHGALALFLLGIVWLKALVPWLILLQVLAIFGAAFLFAVYMSAATPEQQQQQQQQVQHAWVPDAVACADDPVIPMVGARGVAPCSAMALYSSMAAWSPASSSSPPVGKLAEVFAQIKAETGYDPALWVARFPPSVVLPLFLIVLAVVASLVLYAALQTLGGLRRVLSASTADWATRGGGDRTTRVRAIRLDADGKRNDARSAWSEETAKGVFTGDW